MYWFRVTINVLIRAVWTWGTTNFFVINLQVTKVVWALYSFVSLPESFLHAHFLDVPCFAAVLAFFACMAGHVVSMLCLFPHLKQPLYLNLNFGLLVHGPGCLEWLFSWVFLEILGRFESWGVADFFLLLTECTPASWSPCVITCICALVLSSVLAKS